MSGLLEAEYKWANAHPAIPACKQFLAVAQMYMRAADQPTYAILMASAKDVREAMKKEPRP